MSAYQRPAPKIQPGDGDPRHGTDNGYQNLKCRCELCGAAAGERMKQARRDRHQRGLAPDDDRHGTSNGYGNWGCRCQPCTSAWTRDMAVTVQRRKVNQ